MTHKRSEKETRYLRELVGESGEKAHYLGGTPEQRREFARMSKTRKSNTNARQVEEMRAAAGGKKANTAREKAHASKQVAEMRAAACPAALGLIPGAARGLTREQMEDIKARNGIGREDENYINPARR